MNPVNDRPFFPQAVPATLHGVIQSFGYLIHAIISMASDFGFRLNRVLPKDGTEAMENPLPLLSIVAADIGDYPAADWEGAVIYVSDGSAGQKFRGSDGSAWVNLG